MEGGFGRNKLVVCACYIAAFFIEYAFIGKLDAAFDASVALTDIARYDAENALSMIFEAFVVLGLASIWLYGIRTWLGGIAVGLVAALAAGGLHVLGHMGAWILPAMLVGTVAALVLPVFTRGRPAICAIFGVEICLATLQVIFIVVNS